MQLQDRNCSVCLTPTPLTVAREANYDLSKLDGFAFSSRKIPENMHFRLVHCEKCDLLFASPAPKAEDLLAQYEVAEYDSTSEANLASATYAEALARNLDLVKHREGAIDIGSGNGSFLAELLRLGFSEVEGVEPSAAPIAAADPEIKPLLRHRAFQPSDFPAGHYSLITCFQTLEHVYTPGEMTQAIYDLLRPGGAAFFVAHNHRALVTKLMGAKSPIYDIEHVQLFSPRSLETLMFRAGFTSVRVFKITNTYPLNYWLRLAPVSRKMKAKLAGLADKTRLGQIKISVPVGNIGVIGVKPGE